MWQIWVKVWICHLICAVSFYLQPRAFAGEKALLYATLAKVCSQRARFTTLQYLIKSLLCHFTKVMTNVFYTF